MDKDIQTYIDDYLSWLRSEITFEKIGEFYEITTPFLDTDNDYTQFYVKFEGQNIFFTDDGYTLNSLEMRGIQLTENRKKQLKAVLLQYGVSLQGNELILQAPSNEFAKKKHAYIQCIIHVNDLYLTSRAKAASFFLDDIQQFFDSNNIYCFSNVQFTGKSGFNHNYDFAFQRNQNNPERLCLALNNPTKASMGNALFAWNDTLPSRDPKSQLIVFLNDSNTISKGIEDGFSSYNVNTIRWSQRNQPYNLSLLS